MYRNIIDRIDDTGRFALKRLEFSGDTMDHMVGSGDKWAGLASLKAVVEHERPRFVLFSGGGNDIVGDEIKGAIREYDPTKNAEWHLQTRRWTELTGAVQKAYGALIEGIGPLAPIFAHGYDYIIPSNRPVRYDGVSVAGPWVWKEMNKNKDENKNMPNEMQGEVAGAMIDWFNGMLSELEQKYLEQGYFGHLDVRGTLAPNQWQNEIHPTAKGFEVLTRAVLTRLDAKLPAILPLHDRTALGMP
jgi:lysophospholipase L1-like esterase